MVSDCSGGLNRGTVWWGLRAASGPTGFASNTRFIDREVPGEPNERTNERTEQASERTNILTYVCMYVCTYVQANELSLLSLSLSFSAHGPLLEQNSHRHFIRAGPKRVTRRRLGGVKGGKRRISDARIEEVERRERSTRVMNEPRNRNVKSPGRERAPSLARAQLRA